MYGEVILKDPSGGKRTVPMVANAATLIRYKQLFHSDLLSGMINAEGNFDVDVVSKLAFVMAKQAAKADMKALNMDQFIDWLEDFDSMAFIENINEIVGIYSNSKENTSEEKK